MRLQHAPAPQLFDHGLRAVGPADPSQHHKQDRRAVGGGLFLGFVRFGRQALRAQPRSRRHERDLCLGTAEQADASPSYSRGHFDTEAGRNKIVTMVGAGEGALPIPGDVKLSRLVSDHAGTHSYVPLSATHGVYIFALAGEVTCEGTTLGRRDSKGMGKRTPRLLNWPNEDRCDLIETAM